MPDIPRMQAMQPMGQIERYREDKNSGSLFDVMFRMVQNLFEVVDLLQLQLINRQHVSQHAGLRE